MKNINLSVCVLVGLICCCAVGDGGGAEKDKPKQADYKLFDADVSADEPDIRMEVLFGLAPDDSGDVIFVVISHSPTVFVSGGTCRIELTKGNRVDSETVGAELKMVAIFANSPKLFRMSGLAEMAAEIKRREKFTSSDKATARFTGTRMWKP